MRTCGWWWVGCVLLAVVMLPVTARAQRQPPPDPDTEIARRRFGQGSTLYDEGQYAAAIVEFEAARKVKPLPAFDYNIGRCHDRLEHVQEAIDGYERYLAGAPNASDAAETRARVAVLRQRLAGTPLAPAPAAAPPPTLTAPGTPSPMAAATGEPAPLGARRRIATWAVGGAGVALLAGALAAGLVAHTRYGDLKSSCTSNGACDEATVPDAQKWIDDGKGAGLASDVLLGVGLAAVATGVALYFVEGRRPAERHSWQIAPAVSSTTAGFVLRVAR